MKVTKRSVIKRLGPGASCNDLAKVFRELGEKVTRQAVQQWDVLPPLRVAQLIIHRPELVQRRKRGTP